MNTFRVKNFETFQHYKDRAPPWIKLYNELLDDYDFGLLPDATKMHLVAIWLLASRSENKIPYDAGWVAKRINATEAVDLELLVKNGFILLDQQLPIAEHVASNVPADCLSREEGETEDIEQQRQTTRAVAKKRPAVSEEFARFKAAYPRRDGSPAWKAAEKKFNALVKTGVDPEAIISAAGRFAQAEAKRGKVGTEFIPQAPKWLNSEEFTDYAVAHVEAPKETDWNAICVSFKKFGMWSKWGGPAPGEVGCRCPAEILESHGIFSNAQMAADLSAQLKSGFSPSTQ